MLLSCLLLESVKIDVIGGRKWFGCGSAALCNLWTLNLVRSSAAICAICGRVLSLVAATPRPPVSRLPPISHATPRPILIRRTPPKTNNPNHARRLMRAFRRRHPPLFRQKESGYTPLHRRHPNTAEAEGTRKEELPIVVQASSLRPLQAGSTTTQSTAASETDLPGQNVVDEEFAGTRDGS
jgi:hypothetical protein